MRSAGQVKTIDMTKGPMFLPIIRFILHLMATALLQQFYHSADIITVGYSPEPDAVGAIGSTSNYIALIRNLFIGFSVGANVIVAKYIGMKNKENVSRAVHTSLCMSILLGFIGMILGIAFARPVLVAMGLSGKLLSLALSYAYICMLALPVLSLTNFLSAILNAQGNTKTPLYVLSLTGLLNESSEEHGIQVYIGQETSVESMKDCSVVTATYELTDGVYGKIGIVGPKRMDYEKVVSTLKTIRTQLDEIYKK
jgi:Na+-driven multidrug efflux pump